MKFPLMKDNTISALPEGPKHKQNLAELGGTSHIYSPEGKARKQHLESMSGTKNCATLSMEQENDHGNRGSRASNKSSAV